MPLTPSLSTLIAEQTNDFVEKGADLEHDRWSRWQKYMMSKMVEEERFENGQHFKTGNYILPKEFVERWFRQIDTSYKDLSEPEKESDRKETRNYLPLLTTALTLAYEQGVAWELSKLRCAGCWHCVESEAKTGEQCIAMRECLCHHQLDGKEGV